MSRPNPWIFAVCLGLGVWPLNTAGLSLGATVLALVLLTLVLALVTAHLSWP